MNNKYCFEKYEYGTKGIIYKGITTIEAENSAQARLSASKLETETTKLFQIYVPAGPQ
jgi:hypothetical protein